MDEPFASVDAQTRMTLQEELTHLAGAPPDGDFHHPRCS
jgi:ABC-type nitrate/sulfonate/bicarbonate transport system ATPase subunit